MLRDIWTYRFCMAMVSIVVSALALLFTVSSFWWLQARRGKLRPSPVTSFSAAAAPSKFLLRIPVILFNTGAQPLVVCGLRLRVRGNASNLLVSQSFHSTLATRDSAFSDFFHPYAVPGRGVESRFVQFAGGPPIWLTDAPSVLEVEVQLDSSEEWNAIGEVVVHTEIIHGAAMISYSNNSQSWAANALEQGKKSRDELRLGRDSQRQAGPDGEGSSAESVD